MSLLDRRIQNSWQNLEEGRMSLMTITSRLSPELEKTRPSDHDWCLLEVIQHLYLVDRQILKVVQGTEPTDKPGFLDWIKYMALLLAMEVPFKFRAPRSTNPREIPDNASVLINNWTETRLNWFEHLKSAPTASFSHTVFAHPRAGNLTLPQTLKWMTRHQQRHIRQVRKLVTKISSDS